MLSSSVLYEGCSNETSTLPNALKIRVITLRYMCKYCVGFVTAYNKIVFSLLLAFVYAVRKVT